VSRVLLGVTGGIAAYKACELTRLLVKAGHDVIPLVTSGAERFVRAETFHALARRPPGDDLYAHLTRADLLVVAPCTANTLAKLAHGLSDNLPTEAALAHRGPVLLAPAMNPRMWTHPATRANVGVLRARGVELVGPDEGETAEGEWGVGRMAEPAEIASRAEALLAPRSLAGKRVLVTAGGTREPLDSVRFLGNRSSGRMGVALAEEARRRGAEVTLLAANLAVPAPAGVATLATTTVPRRSSPASGRRAASRGPSSWRRLRTSRGRSASGSARARCSSRSAPSTARRGSSGSAGCWRKRTSTSSSTTTSPAPTSGSTRPTTRSCS
jgi:phosphopantothenoylcysteine decarboxylase / phosphopantothenate---cysteine ligase